MRAIPFRLWLLAVVSAALQILPFPISGPVPLWRREVAWFCLTPLVWAMSSRDRDGNLLKIRQAAVLAYASGVIWYLCNCYWIYQTMHLYGELPKLASAGILLLFALYVGLYHALFGAIFGLLQQYLSRRVVLWSAPVVWVAVELARTRITGFPWDLLGYTAIDNTRLASVAAFVGVMGLSFLIVLVNILWILPAKDDISRIDIRSIVFGIALVAVLAVLGSTGHPATSGSANAHAVLLQENLEVGGAADAVGQTRESLLSSFSDLSLHPVVMSVPAAKPDLIVWPESPADFIDSDIVFRKALHDLAVAANAPLVVNDIGYGPRLADGHIEEYNSAAFVLPNGSYAGHYDKMRLVPFGEYVPYKPLFFFAGDLLGSLPFVPGHARKLFTADGHRYGVFICYESIFGDDIRQFVKQGAQVLVNISDDGWYGDSSAPWEHLDMVRMRAIENGRWVLRATNTGVTAAIDPSGRITAELPRHVRSSIEVNFGYRNKLTLYTRFGDWIGWLCVMLTLGLIGSGVVRRRGKIDIIEA